MSSENSGQSEEMLSREQLLHLFSRFSFLVSRLEQIILLLRHSEQAPAESKFEPSVSIVLSQNLALVLDVKKRIVDAVRDNQEAVAVTTAIQEEILLEMGIDPEFGIGCLGKVNTVYENDMELMIKFYQFVAKEEMAIDEAELEPDEFAQKISSQQILQNQQLEMLKRIRSYSCEEQSAILDYLHKELESANFDVDASSILTPRQLQEILRNCN